MPRKPRNATPSYCLHKASGRGYVKLNVKAHYLGAYDAPETRQKYHQLLSEWELSGRQPIAPPNDIRVMDLIEQYWHWAKTYDQKIRWQSHEPIGANSQSRADTEGDVRLHPHSRIHPETAQVRPASVRGFGSQPTVDQRLHRKYKALLQMGGGRHRSV